MSLDGSIILSALIGFAIYLIAHFLIFRRISSSGVIKWLINTFLIGGVFNIGLMFFLLRCDAGVKLNGAALVISCCAAFIIYGLLCYIYVLYFFGPYESSLRMRMLREIYKVHPKGMTLKDILKKYNAETILKTRLDRFVGSGEVLRQGEYYRIGKIGLIFQMLESIARLLQKLTGLSAKD